MVLVQALMATGYIDQPQKKGRRGKEGEEKHSRNYPLGLHCLTSALQRTRPLLRFLLKPKVYGQGLAAEAGRSASSRRK